jgi:hypothetical protein
MIRPEFNVVGLVPDEVYASNQAATLAAGFRLIQKALPHSTPLAVVGGGPSIKQHLDELIDWPGHIWGINQSASWLIKNGVKAPVIMFTVDPDPRMSLMTEGVTYALLGASCHQDLFAKFDKENVKTFLTRAPKGSEEHLEPQPEPKVELFGPSSVTRIFMPAAMLGYKDITFFGCEGSIDETTLEGNATRNDYALGYRSHDNLRLMIIKAGGKEYLTTPDYYITTNHLVKVMRAYPKLKEKSGGMLRGILQNPDDWSCVAVSDDLRKCLYTEPLERYETAFDVPRASLA